MISINDINEKGFIFDEYPAYLFIKENILNTSEPNFVIQNYFRIYLEERGFEVKNLHMVYEDVRKGQSHDMHTHLIPADFQLVVWIPKDEYEGRAFLYGTKDDVKKFYPYFGAVCFMKTNDLNFIHGVEPLLNDTLVRTLLISVNYSGSHGEHLTVSAGELKPI